MGQSKNIEIKARCNDLERICKILIAEKADYKGLDHQIDTYFFAKNGRLKLREGNIENNLIHYNRPDQIGPKQSEFTLFKTVKSDGMKEILSKALGVKVIVDKMREIYFIDHVKIHLDTVRDLGTFIEIEVIDSRGNASQKEMTKTCNHYLKLFGIKEDELIESSYSDLILG